MIWFKYAIPAGLISSLVIFSFSYLLGQDPHDSSVGAFIGQSVAFVIIGLGILFVNRRGK